MAKLRKALAVAAAAGGLAALNRKLEESHNESVRRLGDETRYYRWRSEDLAYTVAGDGPPLLLVHGIYAGASSLEFRKNFGALSKRFRVYAPDLLGCGLSEKPRRRYAPEDVTAQIEEFAREEIGKPTHLIASSLSATLAMPAAVRSPRLFKKLILVCPTGYGSLNRPSGLLGDAIYGFFCTPILGDSLYHALVSRRGIRHYLRNVAYHDPGFATEELVEGYHRVSHGRGAKYFPAAFVAGKLNLGAAPYWPRIPQRTLLCWGREAKITPVSGIQDFLKHNPRAEPRIFKHAALLPHDERSETFNREARTFLEGKSARKTASGTG